MISSDDGVFRSNLMRMRIIAGAIIGSAFLFMMFAVLKVQVWTDAEGPAAARFTPMLSLVAAALLAVDVPLAFIIPGFTMRNALVQIAAGTSQPEGKSRAAMNSVAGKLLAGRQTAMIIRFALLEGVALLGCLAYLLEASSIAMAVVVVTCLLMLASFPLSGREHAWLEQQNDSLRDLRLQGSFKSPS